MKQTSRRNFFSLVNKGERGFVKRVPLIRQTLGRKEYSVERFIGRSDIFVFYNAVSVFSVSTGLHAIPVEKLREDQEIILGEHLCQSVAILSNPLERAAKDFG